MKATKKTMAQNGLTLVELMIAMVLGVFLIGGLLQLFVSSRTTYRAQENISRLQENGRFALDFIARDIRMAGFRGCSSKGSFNLRTASSTNFLYQFSTFIEGFEATSDTAWTPAIGNNDMEDVAMNTVTPIGKSDVISIRRASDQGFFVSAVATVDPADNTTKNLVLDNSVSTTDSTLTTSNANLTASAANFTTVGFINSGGANKCATAMISHLNCANASVFQISATTVATATLNYAPGVCASLDNVAAINLQAASDNYVAGSQVYPINTITFYVKLNPANQLALYRRVGSNQAEELVEGIERMEILYGVDTDIQGTANYGAVNYFTTADTLYVAGDTVTTAANWAKVVSVRIRLLVATTEDNLATNVATGTPQFNGFNTPADRKLRRIFSETITLRNRAL